MSFSIFRIKTVTGANVAGFILGTTLFSMFLMLTLYMQQVLGYSAMKTGVAYLAVAGTSIFWATLASQLVTKVGVKPVLVTGMSLLTVGLIYFTQVSPDGSYLGDLLPGFLIIAVGMAFSFVSISIAALAGIQENDAGLASGLINTSQQIGGALGIAVLSAVAIANTNDAARAGDAPSAALTSGFQAAFWVGAAVAAVGLVVSLVLIRKEELAAAPSLESRERRRGGAVAARTHVRAGQRMPRDSRGIRTSCDATARCTLEPWIQACRSPWSGTRPRPTSSAASSARPASSAVTG